ncbi:hypothetical protein [Homoserinibacter sp. GY 40078]|uniref:hypothetical protein n=1 Tax=Homoserinibacter sp. GY 40078 TaxID=2603275 RepID=UPI0011C86C09|nr:hypothetical protein [Homoserinibacter sp. GY 40078]TXK19797.1 hypothetical protein FVQ89_08035 [Homoserinibacter sp. GY 40078]
MRLRVPVTAALAASLLLLSGCATTTSAPGADGQGDVPAPSDAIAAPGTVIGQGTVLQVDGEDPMLCLGAVAESYPPQCSGPAITGWDWDAASGQESASGVTWGTYAVTGTWDGTTFDAESSVPLALYDPMPIDDPLTDPANGGDTPRDELTSIQNGLDDAPVTVLSSWIENGYLFVQVIYDDGTIQAWADDTYGVDRVAVRSALRDV